MTAALAPPLFAVPNARQFTVSYLDPTKEEWATARGNSHVLLIGEMEDSVIAEALALSDEPPVALKEAPELLELHDIWAKDQQVILLIVPPQNPARTVYGLLEDLAATYQRGYREMVVRRMFAAGPNNELSDSLMGSYGFDVSVPKDYEWTTEGGNTFLFRKTGSDSLALVRHVTVTWKTPIPQGIQGDGLMAWRAQLAADHYGASQRVNLQAVQPSQTTHQGNVTYQILGNWTATRGGKTERGPFILRAEICTAQDRMYLIDGWLYAPEQEQHEYMVEIESILNSFRCGSARSSTQ